MSKVDRILANMLLSNIKSYIDQTISQVEGEMKNTINPLNYINLKGRVEALIDFDKALGTLDDKYFDVLEQRISGDTDNGQRLVAKSDKETK